MEAMMGPMQPPWPLVRLVRSHGIRSPLRRSTDRIEGWAAPVLTVLAMPGVVHAEVVSATSPLS